MSLQNIDTFEQDIAKELKKKEVAVRDIATTSVAVGNAQAVAEKKSALPIILSIIFLLLAGGGGIFGYMYYNQMTAPVQEVEQPQLPVVKTAAMQLREISPAFPDSIGMFVSSVSKTNDGYTLKLSTFSPVYAYILRNEKDFADDLAKSLGVEHAVVGDITPVAPPVVMQTTTTSTTTATTTASTTKVTPSKPKEVSKVTVATTSATSTIPTSTPVVPVPEPTPIPVAEKDMTPVPFTFSDTTINNQNMRVGKSGENVMYYAFIENKALVFSKTSEGIFALKNAILR